jgi:hypothetical protein
MRIRLGILLFVVAMGFALLAGALDDHGRWGGYLPVLHYGPLLLLFLAGSLVMPSGRRSR